MPLSVTSGAALNVHVAAAVAHQNDRVMLYQAGGNQPLNTWYLNGSTTAPTAPIQPASFAVAAPATAGNLRDAVFRHHRHAQQYRHHWLFQWLPMAGWRRRRRLERTPTSPLAVAISGATNMHWVGLFVSGAPSSGSIDWKYLNGSRTMPSAGVTSGNFQLQLPPSLGAYEVRLYDATGSLAVTAPVSASGAGIGGLTLAFKGQDPPVVSGAEGSAADGAMSVSKPQNCQRVTRPGRSAPDCVAVGLRASAAAGQSTLSVSSSAGFAAGDEVIIALGAASGVTTPSIGRSPQSRTMC